MPVIDDAKVTDRDKVSRIVLCSGKVYYDIDAGRDESDDARIAIVRLEQFYPFPAKALAGIFKAYPKATELYWTQEEPKNMGGWHFVEPRLREIKPDDIHLRYVGRTASASPATGSYTIHELEQKEIVDHALTKHSDEISAASEAEVSEKLAPASA